MKAVNHIQRFGRNGRGNLCRLCQQIALQHVNAQTKQGLQFCLGFQTFCNDLHITLVRIVDNVRHDLLLVLVGVNAADDTNIHLDIMGASASRFFSLLKPLP